MNDNSKILIGFYLDYLYLFGPNGYHFNHSWITVFDFNTLDSLYLYKDPVYACLLSNTNKYIAFSGIIYNFNTLDSVWAVNGSIQFSSDDKYLFVSEKYDFVIYNFEEKKEIYRYILGGQGTAYAISHNGEFVIFDTRNIGLSKAIYNTNTVKEDNNNKTNIIYPNPTTGNITIEFEQTNSEAISINIFDSRGAIVRQLIDEYILEGSQNYTFNVRDLAAGIYFVRVRSRHNEITFKLIIKK